ncbi:hypothetical protein TorRG33x02_166030 [Trema orientale]|uniref:Uncharacterized protein n=1 Tax=Trema orientale TaxID=63057 RepID=A0A2P5EPX0_TREOI|nr:hypothetical protein TorRG33x02_166030 [Trema orientale]
MVANICREGVASLYESCNEMVGMLSEHSTEDGDSLIALTEDQINEQVCGTRSGYIKGMGRLPQGDSKKLKSSTSASSETSVQGQSQLE